MSGPVLLLNEDADVCRAARALLEALDRWAMPHDPDREGDAEEQSIEDCENVVEKFADALAAFNRAGKARRSKKRKGGLR